jgi:predicted DCC family thiol-disulfide oxidoreductase YuxK
VKTAPRPRLFYDQDCGFCRWSLLKVLRWSGDGVEAVPIQSERAIEALGDMDHATRMASWHLVLPDGSRFSAGAAVPELMGYLPGARPLAPMARLLVRPIDVVYRLVARNRRRLGRYVGERSCELPRPDETAPKR